MSTQVTELLEQILDKLEHLEMRLDASGMGVVAATDEELDGQYGDPEVRLDPSDWRGESCVGKKYSECPPEFLQLLVKMLMWQYRKDRDEDVKTAGGKPRARYRLRDARLAKGWLARKEKGWNGGGRTPTTFVK